MIVCCVTISERQRRTINQADHRRGGGLANSFGFSCAKPGSSDTAMKQGLEKVLVTLWTLKAEQISFLKETLMIKLKHLTGAMALSLILAGGMTAAFAYTGQELAKNVKVTLKEARVEALKAVPGPITAEELETEGGGSGLRYSLDIKQQSVAHEVGIDAKTGAVLENLIEGAHPD